METEKYWKDIVVSADLIGEKITKGSGYFEKEYRYIKVPANYGYDNYVFFLSEKLVNQSSDNNSWWFSICNDMKIELFYDPLLRKDGKRYVRHKMTGHDLVENIFKHYEVDFKKECEDRFQTERAKKEKNDKANIGTVICGRYTGNIYGDVDNRYNSQSYLSAFFQSTSGTYSNHNFSKVQNVDQEFIVMKMSKYHFLQYEEIINAYVKEYDMYKDMADTLDKHIKKSKKIVTRTENIATEQLSHCNFAIEKVKKALFERLNELLQLE